MAFVVLGSGMAGAIAAGYFRQECPAIFDSDLTGAIKHRAVFRVKNPDIGLILGASLKRIKVTKEIYTSSVGNTKAPTLADCNAYSIKVCGAIEARSIQTVSGECLRYLIQDNYRPQNTRYGYKLVGVEPGVLFFDNGKEILSVKYDTCISTIPLPYLVACIGDGDEFYGWKNSFESCYSSVFVYRFPLNICVDSNIAQTIYYPDRDLSVYRATLETGVLIVESMSDKLTEEEYSCIFKSFGLSGSDLNWTQPECSTIKFGKLKAIDQDFLKSLMFRITEKYRIYLLGRYATWRNLRTDDLVSDVSKIASMMNRASYAVKYDYTIKSEDDGI